MSIEGSHLRSLFPSQILPSSNVSNQQEMFSMQMEFVSQYLPQGVNPSSDSFLHLYNSNANYMPSSSGNSTAPLSHLSRATAAVVTSTTRKRIGPNRDESSSSFVPSILGDDFSAHIQRQLIETDFLIINHNDSLRGELVEKGRRCLNNIMSAIEDRAAKKLKTKQEEIDRANRMNRALAERVKNLQAENQKWRGFAYGYEATANVLSANLEKVLERQAKAKEENNYVLDAAAVAAGIAAKDQRSCICAGKAKVVEENGTSKTLLEMNKRPTMCWSCNKGEPTVLVLPCKHLCLCQVCGDVVQACPFCGGTKADTFTIILP